MLLKWKKRCGAFCRKLRIESRGVKASACHLQMVIVHQNSQQNGGAGGGVAGLKRAGDGNGTVGGAWPPQNTLRVKRPMLGGGRRIIGGPSTPVPRWKLYENPFYDGIAAAAAAAAQQQNAQGGGGRNIAVSARKLAATLWELQEFPFAFATSKSSTSSSCPCIVQHRPSPANKKARNHLISLSENATNPLSPSHESDHHHHHHQHPVFFHDQQRAAIAESMVAKESMVSLHHNPNKGWDSVKKSPQSHSSTRQVAAMRSHVHRLLERRTDARFTQLTSAQANSGSYMVLNRIREMDEQQAASATQSSAVVTTLRTELERARTRIHELELAHKSARKEVDSLMKKMTEEKANWRNKEEQRIRSAVQAAKMEAEDEKKARRRIESVNRKMSRELIEANMAVGKAVQELERERKARELMEDVCDELAREIGEDKAEVEELKRESAKVREEVEEERRMLQMAEVWREERVQMKLAEARLEIEEKNAILDNLRNELESFLKSRKAFLRDAEEDEASCRAAVQEAEDLKTVMDSLQLREALQNSCRSPDTDGAASDVYDMEQNNGSQPDEMAGWGWAAKPTNANTAYEESDPRLETRDQVLERLRRKYEQTGLQHPSAKGSQEGEDDGAVRKWDDDRGGDGSEWNSQSEHQGDDTKEEDASQWESASDQDILEAMELQQSNSRPPTRGSGRGGGEGEDQSGPQDNTAVPSGGYESMCSPQMYAIKPAAEHSSGDDLWKVNTPLNEEQQRRLSGDVSRNFLGRGTTEVSRSSHIRLATEQGIASPSRDWRSPDRGNPHIARGIKGFIEWPKMSRENGVKGKGLDSKVEKVDRRMLKQNA